MNLTFFFREKHIIAKFREKTTKLFHFFQQKIDLFAKNAISRKDFLSSLETLDKTPKEDQW